jgi:hypothetical protein
MVSLTFNSGSDTCFRKLIVKKANKKMNDFNVYIANRLRIKLKIITL